MRGPYGIVGILVASAVNGTSIAKPASVITGSRVFQTRWSFASPSRDSTCSGGLLLLLLPLLLRFGVDGLDLEYDIILVDIDLVVQLQAKERGTLNKVGVPNDVVIPLLSSPLLRAPL